MEFTPILLIELLLVFGSVLAWTIWELVSLRRYRRRQAAEKAEEAKKAGDAGEAVVAQPSDTARHSKGQ